MKSKKSFSTDPAFVNQNTGKHLINSLSVNDYVTGNTVKGNLSSSSMIVFLNSESHFIKEINKNISLVADDAKRERLLTLSAPIGDTIGGIMSYTPIDLTIFLRKSNFIIKDSIFGFKIYGNEDVFANNPMILDDLANYLTTSPNNHRLIDTDQPNVAFRVDHEKATYFGEASKSNNFNNYVKRTFTIQDFLLGEFDYIAELPFVPKDTVGTFPDIRDKALTYRFLTATAYDNKTQQELINFGDNLAPNPFDNTKKATSIEKLARDLRIKIDYSDSLVNLRDTFYFANNIGKVSIIENLQDELDVDLKLILGGASKDGNEDSLMTSYYQSRNLLPNENPFVSTYSGFPVTLDDSVFFFAEEFTVEEKLDLDTIIGKNNTLLVNNGRGRVTDYVYIELIDSATNRLKCGNVGILGDNGQVYSIKLDDNGDLKKFKMPCSPLGQYYIKVQKL